MQILAFPSTRSLSGHPNCTGVMTASWWTRWRRGRLSENTKFALRLFSVVLFMIVARFLCNYQHEMDKKNFDYSTAPLIAVSVMGFSVLSYAVYMFYLEHEIQDMEFDLAMLHMNDDIYSDTNLLMQIEKQLHRLVADEFGEEFVQKATDRTSGLNPPVGAVI